MTDRTPERQREIDQGLRDETGALTFGLVVEEYSQGFVDFNEGRPAPRITTASYDLGRALGQRKAEERDQVKAWMEEQTARSDRIVREILKDRPDLIALYDRDLAKARGVES